MLILAAGLLVVPRRSACAQDADIPREHHAWARFAPSSWKLVRIVTENFNAGGHVTANSVTETKTTLKDAGASGFTLLIESTVELDGKRITAEPQQVVQHYNGALNGQTAISRALGVEAVTIDGKSYPCRVLHYEITGTGTKTLTRAHYSSEVPPYVLRRETTALDASNKVTSHVSVEVKELNVPHTACGQIYQTARTRVEQKHVKGTEVTEALTCLRVPGGVIWHDSTLIDLAGNKLSHSRLELVDYHVAERSDVLRDTRAVRPLPWLSFQGQNCYCVCHESRGGFFARLRAWRH